MLVVTLMIMGLSDLCHGSAADVWADRPVGPGVAAADAARHRSGWNWGGADLVAYEYAPEDKRGFYTSITSIGVALGILLSAGHCRHSVSGHERRGVHGMGLADRLSDLVFFILVGMWIRVDLRQGA